MDLSQLYGPGYAGYLQGMQSSQNRNMQALQGMGMLSNMQTQDMQRNAMQAQLAERQRQAQQQVEAQERMQGLLSQPDDVIQGMLGMPANQVRALFTMGGPGSLSKVLEKNYEMPSDLRMINALPEGPKRTAAIEAKTGISPQFFQADLGGQQAGFVRDPVTQQVQPVFQAEKTAAPGAVPFEMFGLTPEQARTFALNRASVGAPRTTNIVNATERSYGTQFAGEMAKSDISLRDTAGKAVDLADRANRIRQVLASGQVITGAGADARLMLGKALNLVGASDGETISNTETLASSLAQNTLDAIKASGLGAGNGFSNADREFLQKAVGGQITLEAASINRLAEIAHRAAQVSAEKWTKRVNEIPASALEGTGVSRDPISVAPLAPGYSSPGSASTSFDKMPSPVQYKGRRIKGDDGSIYISDGMRWKKQ
jgi:hypothetical protein